MDFWKRLGQPVVFIQKRSVVLLVSLSNGLKAFLLFQSQWAFGQIPECVPRVPDVGGDASGALTTDGV